MNGTQPNSVFFFFNDTATTEIYTLSLHDALPICRPVRGRGGGQGRGTESRRDRAAQFRQRPDRLPPAADRKSTRLNSSHSQISYAVFCLKKKKECENVTVTRCVGAQQGDVSHRRP